jgi:hypothetical protein
MIMQNRKLIKLFMTFFALTILSSCSNTLIVPDPPAPPPSPNENKISYSGEIQPVFTEKCVRCHGVGQNAPTLSDGKSYQSLMSTSGMVDTVNPGNSIIYREMASGGGMSSFCSKANADSVYKWIRQGAKNN